MKNIIRATLFVSILIVMGCTKWDYIDTGIAGTVKHGNMLEYLRSDKYNWTYVDSMITRAGMEDVFSGKNPEYKSFTFFGPTDHSVRKWVFDNKVGTILNVTPEDCRKYLLAHILNKHILRDDFPRGNVSSVNAGQIGTGGETYKFAQNNDVWIHSFQSDYDGVPESGAVEIRLLCLNKKLVTKVASSNIECTNGVVHSLSYTYQFPKIF